MSVVSHWHWHQWICVAKVGEGILSLPAGIAAGTGIVTALLIMTAFYIVTWPRSPTLDVREGGVVDPCHSQGPRLPSFLCMHQVFLEVRARTADIR